MKYIVLLVVLALSFAVALPAEASLCRNLNNHVICILSIQRSAKNYWEYRASVKIDGVERPIEVYDCRDRIRIQKDGNAVPFEPNGAGVLICSALNK